MKKMFEEKDYGNKCKRTKKTVNEKLKEGERKQKVKKERKKARKKERKKKYKKKRKTIQKKRRKEKSKKAKKKKMLNFFCTWWLMCWTANSKQASSNLSHTVTFTFRRQP